VKKIIVSALGAISCMAASGSALAATYLVTVYNPSNEVIATWRQDSQPTPLSFTPGTSTDVSFFDATGLAAGYSDAVWFSDAASGGLDVGGGNGPINTIGAVSYSGLESSPTFNPGIYSEYYGKIIISVPEPTTWAMMLVGLGMIGFAARRRRNVSVTYA
jgi:hypothetical protein